MGFTSALRRDGFGVSCKGNQKTIQIYLETDEPNVMTVRDFTLEEIKRLQFRLKLAVAKVTDGKGE